MHKLHGAVQPVPPMDDPDPDTLPPVTRKVHQEIIESVYWDCGGKFCKTRHRSATAAKGCPKRDRITTGTSLKEAAQKRAVIYFARHTLGLKNAELAKYYGIAPGSVSEAVSRHQGVLMHALVRLISRKEMGEAFGERGIEYADWWVEWQERTQ